MTTILLWVGVFTLIFIGYTIVISIIEEKDCYEYFTVVRTAWPTEHICVRPNWAERRRHKLKTGARVRCKSCEQVWEWRAVYDSGREWVKEDG